MKSTIRSLVFTAVCVLTATPAFAEATGSLDPQLEPLSPFLGKTWKGTFKNSNPDRPLTDVARWERALNGKAIRILHSLNDGMYGGESIIMWDAAKQSLVYHYFSTGGFMSTGTMRMEDGRILTHEKISGTAGGATEVRGTVTFPKEGKFTMKMEYKREGEWGPGREVSYEEDEAAKVVFR